jgi:phosphoribosylformylglycinamidine synthase
VGAVGLLKDYAHRAGFGKAMSGDTLILIGDTRGEMGASLYMRELFGSEDGAPPPVDLAAERKHGDFVRGLIAEGSVTTVHDLSDGGLVVAAAEVALASNVGVTLNASSQDNAHPYLFGEDQGRYLLGTSNPDALLAKAKAAGVHASVAGTCGGHDFASRALFTLPLSELRAAHEGWLPGYMKG